MIFEAAGTSSGQGSPAAPALLQQPQGSCVAMNWLELPLPRAAQFVCGCNSTWEFNHGLIKSVHYQQHTCFPLCKGGNEELSAVRAGLMLALSHLPGIGHPSCALIKPCFVSAPKKLQCRAYFSVLWDLLSQRQQGQVSSRAVKLLQSAWTPAQPPSLPPQCTIKSEGFCCTSHLPPKASGLL